MLLTRLVLTNWKNFQSVDINFKERAFIVGANASGKSNLLDAIRFLKDIVKQAGGLQYAVEKRGGVPKIRCLSARRPSDVSIEVHLSNSFNDEQPEWQYKLTFRHTGGGILKNEALILEESVWHQKRHTLQRINTNTDTDETWKYTHLEQPMANNEFRDIYTFLRDIQYLHVVPQLIRESDSFVLASGKEDFYGRNLLETMGLKNKATRDAYFKRINEFLKFAVPQLEELTLKSDEKTGIPHLQAVCKHWRAHGSKQNEEQLSDGTLRLIGFLWAILDGTGLLLLEEPELYLHSAIVKQLAEFISRAQKRKGKPIRQVFLSTHSYELLENPGIGGAELIVLRTDQESTTVDLGSNISEVRKYLDSGFSPAEAVIPIVAPKNAEKLSML